MRGWAVPVACLALLASPADAGQGRASFQVSVAVPARAVLEIVGQPAVLVLTPDDLARGYKVVSGRYHVSHNDRRGYLLQFVPHGHVAREIRVSGAGGVFVLGADAIEVHRDGGSFEQDMAIEFRIELAPGARAGAFDWPVLLAALPL